MCLAMITPYPTSGCPCLRSGRDCLHKAGLILHLCFVVIPVVIPAVILSHGALSWGWVFVCFPVGVALGLLLYTFLDQQGQCRWLAWHVPCTGKFQFFELT